MVILPHQRVVKTLSSLGSSHTLTQSPVTSGFRPPLRYAGHYIQGQTTSRRDSPVLMFQLPKFRTPGVSGHWMVLRQFPTTAGWGDVYGVLSLGPQYRVCELVVDFPGCLPVSLPMRLSFLLLFVSEPIWYLSSRRTEHYQETPSVSPRPLVPLYTSSWFPSSLQSSESSVFPYPIPKIPERPK